MDINKTLIADGWEIEICRYCSGEGMHKMSCHQPPMIKRRVAPDIIDTRKPKTGSK